MEKLLHIWAIEVDEDRQRCDFQKQADFIADFGGWLFGEAEKPSSPLSSLELPYFTRIFEPNRDDMGAYVRLNFLIDETCRQVVEGGLDRKLEEYKSKHRVFQIKKDMKDAVNEEADLKGAKRFPWEYYRFMHNLSRTAVTLFKGGVSPGELEKMVWTWSHNVFNLFQGRSRTVLEVTQQHLHRL